jgi:hypothetical protein
MVKIARLFFRTVLICLLAVLIAAKSAIAFPSPKRMELGTQTTIVGTGSHLTAPAVFRSSYKPAVDSFEETLRGLPQDESAVPITLEIMPVPDPHLLPPEVVEAFGHNESYWLRIAQDGIRIAAVDNKGALNGLSTLESLVTEGKGEIKTGMILDWPDLPVRALHIQLLEAKRVGPLTPSEIKSIIKSGRLGHYNTLMIQIADGVKFNTMAKIARADAWTKGQFSDVVSYARGNGLDVVPVLKLLTHQEKLLKNKYPQLMYNRVTYDPRKEETYQVVLPMVDEVISLIKPRAVHIGHDEVAGHSPKSRAQWLAPGEKMLPPELFLKDVLRLYSYLSGKGLETWMWGDMLLGKAEFPVMPAKQLHGVNGYAALFNEIPQDIVICDWHYYGRQTKFPTLLAFQDAGHEVLGATFKNVETIDNFSRYAAGIGAKGMIATTWYYVPLKQWEEVRRILDVSAEDFWNAGGGK